MKYPSKPLAYALVLENNHPNISMNWVHGGQLDKERDICLDNSPSYTNPDFQNILCSGYPVLGHIRLSHPDIKDSWN